MKRLIAAGEEEKIEFNQEQYDKSEEVFKYQIKGLIGRDVYDMETLIKVFNDHSDTFKKAYEIIKDDRLYNKLLGK